MSEAKNLEDYKAKVRSCLTNGCNLTETAAEQLMKDYADDFQECFEENWSPGAMAAGMSTNLL